MKPFARILLFLIIFCLICFQCNGEESIFFKTGQGSSQNTESGSQTEINTGVRLASFFRDHISAVDGDRCPSLPTCSSYIVEAFKKHGFFVGWMMTVDRLIHEADEASISPLVHQNGKIKILDPVENNDFWWFSINGKSKD